MRKILASAILAAAVVAVPFSSIAQVPPSPANAVVVQPAVADVPVKEVVLFSSGVGYFEHFGTVNGDGSTELRFKTNQINDILKSLVLQDMDGGKVTTITYPSQDPIAKTLKSFQIDITANPSLADLLNQLRGAKVTATTTSGEKLAGTILGVEKKQKPAGDKGQIIEVPVLNVVSDGKIVSQPMELVNSIQLDDPELQDELTKALTALAGARDQDKKPVKINFSGNGERHVRIGYVVETPVWKTSYRLILGDRKDNATTLPANGPQADGNLQGWAIVENQTDNDWNNVQLSLVSGRPISFIEDLYQPIYIPRPVVQPELYASLRPQTYDAGMERDNKAPEAFGLQRQQQQMAKSLNMRGGAAAAAPAMIANGGEEQTDQALAAQMPMDATASVSSLASAAKVGELFQYTVGNVSLARQRSAMIPIITDPIEVERLSIYNPSVLPRNPLNGARVKNTTKKHLLAGPVTVIDGATYAGDAQIDNVPPDQERLLSYGVDLEMLVDATNNKSDSQLQTGKIVKGVLYISRKDVRTQDYIAQNKSDHDKTLIIEHARQGGWDLVDTDKPIETTDAVYRFKGQVAAGKSSKLTVKEQIVQQEAMAIMPGDLSQLDFYSKAGEIPKDVKDALGKAIAMKQALVDTQQLFEQSQQKLGEITNEQNRIRENMKTVSQSSQYYTRLMTKLNDQETQIEKTQTEMDDLQKKQNDQQKALEEYLQDLNVG
jgi:hypothetical protein